MKKEKIKTAGTWMFAVGMLAGFGVSINCGSTDSNTELESRIAALEAQLANLQASVQDNETAIQANATEIAKWPADLFVEVTDEQSNGSGFAITFCANPDNTPIAGATAIGGNCDCSTQGGIRISKKYVSDTGTYIEGWECRCNEFNSIPPASVICAVPH